MSTFQDLGFVATIDRNDDRPPPARESTSYRLLEEELPLSAEAGSLERWLDLNA